MVKKVKKIKKAKKVNPFDDSWFDLSKYDKVKDFDIKAWEYQLSQRFLIHNFSKENPEILKKTGVEYSEELKNTISGLIELIKTDPILPYKEYKTGILSIRETNYFDLFFASHTNKSLKDVFNLSKNGVMDTGITPVISNYNEGIGLERALITINRRLTDDQLIEYFINWLKNHRAVTEHEVIKGIFTNNNFEKWNRMQLLAYLDLKLIANAENTKVSHKRLGELLFPMEGMEGLDTTERVGKTVKKLEKSIFNENSLYLLKHQANEALKAIKITPE